MQLSRKGCKRSLACRQLDRQSRNWDIIFWQAHSLAARSSTASHTAFVAGALGMVGPVQAASEWTLFFSSEAADGSRGRRKARRGIRIPDLMRPDADR